MKVFALALMAGAASAVILAVLLATGLAWRLAMDLPNERSLHTRPTPRVGGWALSPVVVAGMAGFAPSLWLVTLGLAALALMSVLDDRYGLPARMRFAAHLAAVVALITAYPAPVAWPWLMVLAVLLVWLINLYNFMDGADGLAGGMAVAGFTAYAVAAARADTALASAAALTAGAAAGFLVFNRPPARVFLGDAGSVPLGFLAGALGYWGWAQGTWPVWFPALVFMPFIADASVTLARRLLRGEKFWEAHREHVYQKMILMDGKHAGTVGKWYGVIASGVILALLLLGTPVSVQWCVLIAWSMVLLGMGWRVEQRWRRHSKMR